MLRRIATCTSISVVRRRCSGKCGADACSDASLERRYSTCNHTSVRHTRTPGAKVGLAGGLDVYVVCLAEEHGGGSGVGWGAGP